MGRAPCCEKVGLNRGRWTQEEDDKLRNYILTHGEGSWRSLPKNAGLLRCGKSCRLRWINYLRADVKRGNFSTEEEEIIVKLRATFGNRWSLIANQLSRRTDNEIKNYWNSHLSRKLHYFKRSNNEKLQLIMESAAKASMEADTKRKEAKTQKGVLKKNKKRSSSKTLGVSSKKVREQEHKDELENNPYRISTNSNEEVVPLPQTQELDNNKSSVSSESMNFDFVLPISPCEDQSNLLSPSMFLVSSYCENQEMATSDYTSSSFVFCPSGMGLGFGEEIRSEEEELLGPFNKNEEINGLNQVLCFNEISDYEMVVDPSGDHQNTSNWYRSSSSMTSPLDDNCVGDWSWEDLMQSGFELWEEKDRNHNRNYEQPWLDFESTNCFEGIVEGQRIDNNLLDFSVEKQNALVAWLLS